MIERTREAEQQKQEQKQKQKDKRAISDRVVYVMFTIRPLGNAKSSISFILVCGPGSSLSTRECRRVN